MKSPRTVTAAFLIAVAAASGGLTAAAPAQAASGPGGSVITCSLKVNYPHNSGHVSGTINVTSEINCSSNVDGIYISTGLRGTQSKNGWKQGFNTNYRSSNAAAPCANGTYWGIGSGTVTFPSGYTPRVQNVEGSGASRTVNCSIAGFAAGSDESSATTVYEFSATAPE